MSSPAKVSPKATRSPLSQSVASTLPRTSTNASPLDTFHVTTRQPTFEELNLSHIINGETCSPISYADFASFVTHKEFTTENLLFVIWFRSYRERYNCFDQGIRNGVPVPSTRLGDRYAPFAYLNRPADVGAGEPVESTGGSDVLATPPDRNTEQKHGGPSTIPRNDFNRCEWAVDGRECNCGDPNHHRSEDVVKKTGWFNYRGKGSIVAKAEPTVQHTSSRPMRPPAGTVPTELADQPLRDEARRAFATFLRKGGSRELGVSDELREFAKACLRRSTAPEIVSVQFFAMKFRSHAAKLP